MTDYEPFKAETLPSVVTTYLEAHVNHHYDRAAATFTPDAVVIDDGHTYTSIKQIRPWLERSSTEWEYTTTPTGQQTTDDEHVIVRVHLEGNFPGGQVDLRYQFTLTGNLITALAIEV